MGARSVTLHLMCGKIASGKSTMSKTLAQQGDCVLISEDEWLHALFGDRMRTLQDFVSFSAKLRTIIGPHIVSLLQAGTSVILDFQANTVQSRKWMKGLLDQAGCHNQLHVLDTPDELCIRRLHLRNSEGNHPFAASEEMFWQISKHFEYPDDSEGFEIHVHRPPETETPRA